MTCKCICRFYYCNYYQAIKIDTVIIIINDMILPMLITMLLLKTKSTLDMVCISTIPASVGKDELITHAFVFSSCVTGIRRLEVF